VSFHGWLGGYCADSVPGDDVRSKRLRRAGGRHEFRVYGAKASGGPYRQRDGTFPATSVFLRDIGVTAGYIL
jgi:hypothetical protein